MTGLIILHVGAGTIAVFAGAAALLSQKGTGIHRAAGNVFFVSMLAAAGAGAYVAFLKPEMITFIAGVFTVYLVATAWATVRREEKTIGPLEYVMPLAALAVAAAGAIFGLDAQSDPTGLKDGYPSTPYFFFGGLSLLAAAFDSSVLARRGLAGRQRIARHLWRMCFALYIAAGSLFSGPGAKVFPESLRGSPILAAPEMAVLVSMFVFLAVALFTRRYVGATRRGS